MALNPGSVLITGSNRGIGLELVKQFLCLSVPPKHIFATCRQPDVATELQELEKQHPGLYIIGLDVTDYSTLPALVEQVKGVVGDEGLNLLINNAGLAIRDPIGEIKAESLRTCFEINAVAPIMIAQAFLPLINQAALKNSNAPMSCSKAAIVNMSTKVASCADNNSGGRYSYRLSKAAMNMSTVNLAVDLRERGVLSVALHPGWVVTEMGGPNALINTSTSVQGLLTVMAGLTIEQSGRFFDYKGIEIPW